MSKESLKTSDMARKSYDQYCGLARALDVIGERWTLLIVRNLFLGPRRYSDLMDELPGITTNLLAKRLAEMTKQGLVTKRTSAPPYSAKVYELTNEGATLEPAVHALGAWGGRFMGAVRRADTKNLGWALFALKRRYQGGVTGSIGLVSEQRRYTLRLGNVTMAVRDDDTGPVDATVTADSVTLREAFIGGDADARGRLVIEGKKAVVTRAFRAFSAPQYRGSTGPP